ncbi:hypothetical protein cypCar_00010514 [Cyprinus carpio]|nr:hypothetical protein cypCar_00010514 [Cyprinus carpio]
MSGAAHTVVWLPDVLYFFVAPRRVGTAILSRSVQIMGTSASATSQAAPFAPTHQADHQGNGMAEHRRFLQSVNIRNSKAKSIITNKVAPVVIT